MGLPEPWRVVNSLLALRDQVNQAWPNRDKASDGTVADASHSTTSDHYPHHVDTLGAGYVVTALDITHDPGRGPDTYILADIIRQSRDPRIKYIISHRRIASNPAYSHASDNWAWRAYDGSDPHDNHMHVSVLDAPISDSTTPWRLSTVDGGSAMSRADDLLDGLNGGFPHLPSGEQNNLVVRQLGLEQWQRETTSTLASILNEVTTPPPVRVDFSAADVADALLATPAFKAMLTEAMESAIARVRVIVDPAV